MGQFTHSMKENSSRSFSSDTKKNRKDYRAITLQSGKELGDSKVLLDSKKVENEKVEMRRLKIRKLKMSKWKLRKKK